MKLDQLYNLFLDNEQFCDKDGKLLKNSIIQAALNLDPQLISLLKSKKEVRELFFISIDNVLIFDKIKFQNYVTNKEFLPDSYTKFAQSIGLASNDEFLSSNRDVVIDFPYKDCILEGGQTNEDKRNEIFYNQILASEDIDRLFDPKALVNWKKYEKSGEKEVDENSLHNNIVIKGNNLICLHSLIEIYRGKIKTIYIDPPYNSGGGEDIFTYNNSFKRSTWLTFMKNRLEVAHSLLTDDGFIAIAIDHHELAYLVVLADEIFGRDNRINIVTVAANPQGRNQEKFFGTSTEFMIVYSKNIDLADFNQVALDPEKLKEFDKKDSDGKRYKLKSYVRVEDGPDKTQQKIKRGLHYPIYVSSDLKKVSLESKKGYVPVHPMKNEVKKVWKKEKDGFLNDYKKGIIVIKKDEDGNITINHKMYESEVIKTHWVDPKYSARVHGTQRLNQKLGKNSVSFPKSIHTVKDALKLMTKKDDIILDFFAGSGTTGEAVMMLNKEDGGKRKFILIEQLDAHINECIKRIQLALEENNCSSFVYCELAKWNEKAKDEILKCNDKPSLVKKFKELSEDYQLKHNLDVKQFIDIISFYKEEENWYENAITSERIKKGAEVFESLHWREWKMKMIEMIDMNQLYISRSDMDDKSFKIKKADKNLTSKFYKE